jgi:competence protein ComEA
MNLPGVGEKTADMIIEYRNSSRFRKIEDIMNVKGIGPKKFENFKEYIEIK